MARSFPKKVFNQTESPLPKHGESKTTMRKVPHAKKPKTRPPRSLRDNLGILQARLPKYTGPYTVGTMEIEVPVDDPQVFSHIRRHHENVLRLETVLMTVYYPAAIGSGSGPAPSGGKHWSRETWLPRPRYEVAKGYGYFGGVGHAAIPLFLASTWFTKLPAYRNAPLATHWPPPEDIRKGGIEVKNRMGDPPPGERDQPKFPLAIFSHGLGGNRTMYSSICGELASYGFVVLAVEHRDGSGPMTYVNRPPSREEEPGEQELRRTSTGGRRIPLRKKGYYDKLEYLFPIDNPNDTAPNNEEGPDRQLRDAQIDLRCAEILEAYKVIQKIAEGHGATVSRRNLRKKGYKGGSSHGLEGIDWSAWKDRVHLQQVTMMGHSFGGATTVSVLRDEERYPWISQGIIYDIWGGGLYSYDARERPPPAITRPLLAINSEAFSYWEANYKLVRDLVTEAAENGALAWLMTVRGTVHVSQSDFSILYSRVCSWLMKMTADPVRALDINVNASLEFLRLVMPARLTQISRSLEAEGLLRGDDLISSFDDLPASMVRQPDKKWMAVRLKINHELRHRLDPRTQFLRLKRYRRRRMLDVPDCAGAVCGDCGGERGECGCGGGGGVANKNEIWMHIAPSQAELEKHGVQLEMQVKQFNREAHGVDDAASSLGDARKGEDGKEQQVNSESSTTTLRE